VTKENERLNTDYRSSSSSGHRGFSYLIAPISLGNDSSGFCAAWAGLAQRRSQWRVIKAEAQNISASNLQGFGTEKITKVESLQEIIAEMETTETTGRASADCPSSVSMRSTRNELVNSGPAD
jgi:hypothetical protein